MAKERKDLNRRLSKSCNLKQQQKKNCSFFCKRLFILKCLYCVLCSSNIIHQGRVKKQKKGSFIKV